MSRLLGTVKSFSNYVKQSEAPVDEDGARPTPSLLSRKIEDLEEEVKRGPALSLSDLSRT
ncbi:hypothetical protein CERSUDRAFT_100997 [Gelatoporia subvermispora B]|uniref:Uncharacterized protein n=1 Tax=Ceriporiopsis subvermispora (strain B) TaxID=914234 RepID=M2QXW1_CERS8|nr:hypothetical protein CERSUDRAFT_100997 [Gelatoporia subvermispora B]